MDGKDRPTYSLYIGLMVCGIGVLVLGSVLGAFVYGRHVQDTGVRDFQRTIGSLSPADYALPDLPDQDNAAHWFEEAARSIHLDGAQQRNADVCDGP